MAKNFGRVNVSISASTGGLTKGLQSASGQMRGFSSQMASMNSKMTALVFMQGAQMFAGFVRGISNATRSLISMGQAQAGVIDSNAKLSRRLGVTYGELAGLKLAGELAGVSMETIGAAMTKADVAMTKARSGSKAAAAAFQTLGLNLDSLQGMSGADRFEAIAAAISQLPSAAERSAAAVALFGRSGAQLLPLFEGGANGIAQARAEAEKFGLALTGMQSKQVEAMNDAFTRVRAAISGVVGQVVAYLAPAIQGVVKQFTDFIGTANGANIGQAIGEALLDGAEFLAGVGDYIIANFGPSVQKVFAYLSQVGEQWGIVADFLNRVGQFFYGAFKLFEAVGNSVAAGLLYAASFFSKAAGEAMAQYSQAAADNFAEAGKAMTNAFSSSSTPIGEAIATPMTDAVQGFRRTAREAATAIEESVVNALEEVSDAVGETAAASSQALSAIVAGGSAGESFRNSLMRGADPRNTGNSAEEKIADNTEETNELLEELPEQFASAMNAQFGLATITA
jgi:hypothetical protein